MICSNIAGILTGTMLSIYLKSGLESRNPYSRRGGGGFYKEIHIVNCTDGTNVLDAVLISEKLQIIVLNAAVTMGVMIMQIVIDIPEKVKQQIDENLNACTLDMYDCVMLATKNGTPLPKGYGGFLDADFIEWNSCEDMFNCPSHNMECKDCSRKMCRIYKH